MANSMVLSGYVISRLRVLKVLPQDMDLIPEASSLRIGKNSTNTLVKIHRLKIKQVPSCVSPAQLPLILLGVNVNVLTELYTFRATIKIAQPVGHIVIAVLEDTVQSGGKVWLIPLTLSSPQIHMFTGHSTFFVEGRKATDGLLASHELLSGVFVPFCYTAER